MTDEIPEPACRVMAAMRKAAKTMPDLGAVEALQEFACLYIKIEPLLTADMKAMLFSVGSMIAKQADEEMTAMVHAVMAINKARKS